MVLNKVKTSQFETIQEIRDNFNAIFQIGGGIKDFATIDKLMDIGVDRVVLGSIAVKNIELTKQFFNKYGAD